MPRLKKTTDEAKATRRIRRSKNSEISESLEEQLANLNLRIQECENTLKELKNTRKELLKQIEAAEKEKLYAAFKETGLKLEDIMNMLSKTNKPDPENPEEEKSEENGEEAPAPLDEVQES